MDAPIVTIRLGGEPQGAGRPRFGKRKASDEQLLAAYNQTRNVWIVAKTFGMCGQSVHERLSKLGKVQHINLFTDEDRKTLKEEYEAHAATGRLDRLASRMGRTRQFLARQANALGLTRPNRDRVWASGQAGSQRAKDTIPKHGHPRGMLGKTILTAEGLTEHEKLGKPWANITPQQRSTRTLQAMETKVELYGSCAPLKGRGTWKAGWREIGGKRKYFRSRWEANYARYLEWLKQRKVISEWHHEPETFWFDAIQRGVRSYLPDFRVHFPNGKTELHEVKGWMDSRSRTTIRRMAKYHPEQVLIVIDAPQYNSIVAKVSRMIEGWE